MREGIEHMAFGAALLLALAVASGCASTGPDPWHSVNRPIFGFNEGVDHWVLEPVAEAWDFVLPERIQTGIRNFFTNLNLPAVFVNNLLQAKPLAAAQDLGRLLINTTVGVAGFVDMASRLDIPAHDEDFGQTLGRWGVPGGPYLVLPLLGSFTVRDALAWPVDAAAQPHVYFVAGAVTAGASAVAAVNARARVLEFVRENRETSLDYYVFVRNAYLQSREREVSDAVELDEEESEELYYPEEEGAPQ